MTNLRKMLLITGALIATIAMMQARSMKNFDANTLNPYIARAKATLIATEQQLQFNYTGGKYEVFWSDEDFARDLYPQQKAALKVIVKELKHQAKDLKKSDKALWLPARQLYKAFKHDVYKNWKTTFKTKLQEAREQNDPFIMVMDDRQTVPYSQEKPIV
jgi:hypothetical protein